MNRLNKLLILFCICTCCCQTVAGQGQSGECHSVSSPERVSRYWTPERMRSAKPYPLPTVDIPEDPRAPAFHTRSATCTADFANVSNVQAYSKPPSSAIGRLFFRLGGQNMHCTAAIGNAHTIWTAGHCLMNPSTFSWAESITFVPGYNNGKTPFGSFSPMRLCVALDWVFQRFTGDYGIAIFSQPFDAALGAFPLVQGLDASQAEYKAYSYVDKVQRTCHSGMCMRDESTVPASVGILCDAGGMDGSTSSSGGPWLVSDSFMVGVSSYIRNDHPNVVYSPYFNATTYRFWMDHKG